jgi:NDP-sugar pyrophosphorylase family protein
MIVIPMAGMSRRFREAGYDQPKFMLNLHGRTLFAHSVGSFAAYFATEPFLFIAREEPGVATFLAQELQALGVAAARTIMLERPTLGQADTVRLGLLQAGIAGNTAITIFNIDTFRPGFCYPEASWMTNADGYLEVMPGSDPGFSYVLPAAEGEGRVDATAEKTVISNLASTGLYHFRRAGDFLDIMDRDERAASAHGELYVAPLYNALIARGQDVRYHAVGADDVIFCGTPSQYHDLLAPGGGS